MKRILLIPSSMEGGVYYYRIYTPFKRLVELYEDEFDITINNNWNFNDEQKDYIGKNYDVVVFHQCLYVSKFQDEVWKMIVYCKKEYGTRFVLDLDDYWSYPKIHPAYDICAFNAFPDKMMINLKLFDYVTTTTKYFMDVISEYFDKEKIEVFENAISDDDEQFSMKKSESTKLRLGLTGGSSHTEDIKQILDFPKYLTMKQLNGIELVFCGYNDKDAKEVTIDEDGKIVSEEDIPRNKNWWCITEDKFKERIKNYRRVESKNIVKGEFGKIYEDIDVLLVPLCGGIFNRCKSELKFIEAGYTNTAVIASDVIPYNNFGVDKESCILVKKPRPELWAKAIKKILRDKSLLEKIRENNNSLVKKYRNLDDITKKRYYFYKRI